MARKIVIRSEEEKRRLMKEIAALKASGVTAGVACDQLGLKYGTYASWLKQDKKAGKKLARVTGKGKFHTFTGNGQHVPEGKVEIRLSNGACVSCGVEQLKAVLEVLK